MIAIAIEIADERILEFAAVNEENKLFHCFTDHLGFKFAEWLGYNYYDIVAVNFCNIRPFLLKVPNFPVWNRRVLDLESLYFNGISVPRLIDIDGTWTNFPNVRVKARVIIKAFLKKKRELLP